MRHEICVCLRANYVFKFSDFRVLAPVFVSHCVRPEAQLARGAALPSNDRRGLRVIDLVGDDECIPDSIEDQSVDLVISNMSLHWVNDLPGTFARVRRVLKPDGVFLASMCEIHERDGICH